MLLVRDHHLACLDMVLVVVVRDQNFYTLDQVAPLTGTLAEVAVLVKQVRVVVEALQMDLLAVVVVHTLVVLLLLLVVDQQAVVVVIIKHQEVEALVDLVVVLVVVLVYIKESAVAVVDQDGLVEVVLVATAMLTALEAVEAVDSEQFLLPPQLSMMFLELPIAMEAMVRLEELVLLKVVSLNMLVDMEDLVRMVLQ